MMSEMKQYRIKAGSAAELVRAIEEVRALVRDSPEEELFCYALDLFRT